MFAICQDFKVEEKISKMSFFGHNLVQDYEMEDDETDTYIDPRFRTVEPWSNEAIETWKYDRKRKYPTFTKLESAKRVKQALEEKRRRMREARANQMKERQNTDHQGKRKFRNRMIVEGMQIEEKETIRTQRIIKEKAIVFLISIMKKKV